MSERKDEADRGALQGFWLPCLFLTVLFLGCASLGFIGLYAAGPLVGIGGVIAGFCLYAQFGPSPLKGLVPGLLSLAMSAASVVAVVLCVVRLFGAD